MGRGAMGLFGANMADFQMGLALDAMDDKAGGAARRLNQRVAAQESTRHRCIAAATPSPRRHTLTHGLLRAQATSRLMKK